MINSYHAVKDFRDFFFGAVGQDRISNMLISNSAHVCCWITRQRKV